MSLIDVIDVVLAAVLFGPMPRFYFRLESDQGNAKDDGLDLPDLAAAHQHALAASAAVITEELAGYQDSIILHVIISNEAGERVARVRIETEVTDSEPPFDG